MKPRVGDQVLATKYDDGHCADHWCVGWYAGMDGDRHMVLDNEGLPYRANGFRRAERITWPVASELIRRANAENWERLRPTASVWELLKEISVEDPLAFSARPGGRYYYSESIVWGDGSRKVRFRSDDGLHCRKVVAVPQDAILSMREIFDIEFEGFIRECAIARKHEG